MLTVTRDDWAEQFNSIDLTNKKGEGNVLFRVSLETAAASCWLNLISQEFFEWAINKHIDFMGDMGVNEEDGEQ